VGQPKLSHGRRARAADPATGFSLELKSVGLHPIISSATSSGYIIAGGGSTVRVGESFHMMIPEVAHTPGTVVGNTSPPPGACDVWTCSEILLVFTGGNQQCSFGHWKGTINASGAAEAWERLESVGATFSHNCTVTAGQGEQPPCSASASLFFNSDRTRWELFARTPDGSADGGEWRHLHSKVGGFDALASASGWQPKDGAPPLSGSAGSPSAPFYDAHEGSWHLMAAAATGFALYSSTAIGGPYSSSNASSK